MTTNRKTYSPEFKSEALKLAKLKGISAQLKNWVFMSPSYTTAEHPHSNAQELGLDIAQNFSMP